jgi:hypothetical protein
VLAQLHSTVGSIVTAAGIDVPVVRHAGKLLDLPAEQPAVELPRTLDIVPGISNQTMLAAGLLFFA